MEYECWYCGAIFERYEDLKKCLDSHPKTAVKPGCGYCLKYFDSYGDLLKCMKSPTCPEPENQVKDNEQTQGENE